MFIVNFLNSNILVFFVFWVNFFIYYDFVFGYEVNWKVIGSLLILLGLLGRIEN